METIDALSKSIEEARAAVDDRFARDAAEIARLKEENAKLRAALTDIDEPRSTVADCLRELLPLIPEAERLWRTWCVEQAEAIDAAMA